MHGLCLFGSMINLKKKNMLKIFHEYLNINQLRRSALARYNHRKSCF